MKIPASADSTLDAATFDEAALNEAETRAELIDPALREAGWGVADASQVGVFGMCLSAFSGICTD